MNDVNNGAYMNRYAETMRRMWAHTENDQRPAVRRWLHELRIPVRDSVIDIGCGDGYYLDLLIPKTYIAVDPNTDLVGDAVNKARGLGSRTRNYTGVLEAAVHEESAKFGLKLLLHSLLYLTTEEAEVSLLSFPSDLCLVVHPLPLTSTTIEFERSLGIYVAESLVACKERILGAPLTSQIARTHLCFNDYLTSDEDLAFIVAHRAYPYGDPDEVARLSLAFVKERRAAWSQAGVVKIPQWQVMEVYKW